MSTTGEILKNKFAALRPLLSARARRRGAAVEAQALGWGGVTRVAEATGRSRATIQAGMAEWQGQQPAAERERLGGRGRRPGAGRKRLEDQAPGLLQDLEALVAPAPRGDPPSPLRWTCQSPQRLADALQAKGYQMSARKVAALLTGLNDRLPANRKVREGTPQPDRNAQYDFLDTDLGQAIPAGVYDVPHHEGWVRVGVDHETADVAVASIKRWWSHMGRVVYPQAEE